MQNTAQNYQLLLLKVQKICQQSVIKAIKLYQQGIPVEDIPLITEFEEGDLYRE
ncbi:hypothetical protein [Cysteiniphilum sp. JM-1]|uniref:hypothetical protein n=1 Tax=Cysteiniphilum sp. JM-1 TaxID=2610891 RepID=UPI00168D4BFF|nr:hypothetical protein [Cysteiniphilum sp. JM-1]